jgi:hypothetical protein
MSQDTTSTSPVSLTSARSDQVRLGLFISIIGLMVFLLGAKPEWFLLDRSPVIGFVQISVFTFGLGFLATGGYISLAGLWKNQERSILSDIGTRLIATGYVIAVFAGMADIFGLGTQPLPMVPFFGPLQAVGVQIGQVVIATGMTMMIPFQRFKQ